MNRGIGMDVSDHSPVTGAFAITLTRPQGNDEAVPKTVSPVDPRKVWSGTFHLHEITVLSNGSAEVPMVSLPLLTAVCLPIPTFTNHSLFDLIQYRSVVYCSHYLSKMVETSTIHPQEQCWLLTVVFLQRSTTKPLVSPRIYICPFG